ncbi:MAG: helical backbone metal receptor [Methanomicrobiales archaeon]|nr:helical backbone metal receptor [Methanomicrobiales archaeon]
MRISPLLALVLILFCTGCTILRTAPGQWVNITDDMGDTVMVPVPVRRVVSLAPSETEIVGALGRTDLLVGRSDACNWPPEVMRVPAVGAAQTFRIDAVTVRDPDLILATPHVEPDRLDVLRERGYAVLVFAPETVEEIYRNILTMGEAIGEQRNASRVVEGLRAQEKEFRDRNRGLPPVRAIYVILDDPLYVAGNLTYENSLIAGAGGINLMAGGDWYLMAAEESFIRLDPEVILVPADGPAGSSTPAGRFSARPAFANLSAVKNHRVCAVDPDIAHRPSPRVVQGLELFSACLHENPVQGPGDSSLPSG